MSGDHNMNLCADGKTWSASSWRTNMIEVLKQALEALETCGEDEWHTDDNFGMSQIYNEDMVYKAITSLRQAIAELESQEPVAWITLQREAQQIVESKLLWKKFIDGTPLANDIACWMANFALQHNHPPQRTWVGLTNDEVNNFAAGCHLGNSVQGAIYKAEAKLKEKNT